MVKITLLVMLSVVLIMIGFSRGVENSAQAHTIKWKVHDPDRPMPPVVNPGPAGEPAFGLAAHTIKSITGQTETETLPKKPPFATTAFGKFKLVLLG